MISSKYPYLLFVEGFGVITGCCTIQSGENLNCWKCREIVGLCQYRPPQLGITFPYHFFLCHKMTSLGQRTSHLRVQVLLHGNNDEMVIGKITALSCKDKNCGLYLGSRGQVRRHTDHSQIAVRNVSKLLDV